MAMSFMNRKFGTLGLFFFCLFVFTASFSIAQQASGPGTLHCPNCDRHYPKQPKYCPNDGTRLVEARLPQKKCPQCQLVFHNGENYCPHHGLKLVRVTPKATKCKSCGRLFLNGEKFCPVDGAKLTPGPIISEAPKNSTGTTKITPQTNSDKPSSVIVEKPSSLDRNAAANGKSAQLIQAKAHAFAAATKSSANIPVGKMSAGKVELTASFEGGGSIILLFYAAGRTRPILRKEGRSPLIAEVTLDPDLHPVNVNYDAIIMLGEGNDAVGKLEVRSHVSGFEAPKNKATKRQTSQPQTSQGQKSSTETMKKPAAPNKPKAAMPKPQTTPETSNKNALQKHAFEISGGKPWSMPLPNVSQGLLSVKVNFPTNKRLSILLIGPNSRQPLVRQDGGGPLVVNYSVPKSGEDYELILVPFADKEVKGSVTVQSKR